MKTADIDASGASRAAEATFGTPSYYRIWYGDPASTGGSGDRLEFGGWLIGWGDGIVYGRSSTINTEVSVFLARDGSSVVAVTIRPWAYGPALESPPDLWATYAAHHDDLKLSVHWLVELQRNSPYAISSEAISNAMVQAEKTLEMMMERNEPREAALAGLSP